MGISVGAEMRAETGSVVVPAGTAISPPRPQVDPPVPGIGRRLLGFGVWSLVGRVAPFAASTVTAIVIARLLPSHEVGTYTVLVSLVYVGALVGSCGLSQVVVRFASGALAAGTARQARLAVRRCVLLGVVGATLCAAIYTLAGHALLTGLIGPDALTVPTVLVGGWIVTSAAQTLVAEALRGLGDARGAAVYGGFLSSAFMLAFVVVVAVGHTRLPLDGLVLAVLVTTAAAVSTGGVVLALRLRALARRDATDPRVARAPVTSEPALRRLVVTALPLLVVTVLLAVLTQCDLWVLAHYRPGADVGVYALASRTATLAGYPTLIVNSALLPLVAELHSRGNLVDLRRFTRLSATVATIPAILAAVVFTVAGGRLLGLVYGGAYRAGGWPLAILGAGNVVAAWTGPCGIVLAMCGRERLLLAVTAVSGLLTGAAMIVVVPLAGPLGAATASAGGLALYNIGMLLAARWTEQVWTAAGLRELRWPTAGGRHRVGRKERRDHVLAEGPPVATGRH